MLRQTKYGESSSQKFVFRLSVSTEPSSHGPFLTGWRSHAAAVNRPPPRSATAAPAAPAKGDPNKLPTTDSARALHQHLTSNAFDHSTAGNRRFPGRSRAPSFHYGPAVDDPLDGHLRPDCVHRRDFRCMYRSSCYRG
ncbi:uncharacterized protein LOC112890764 isoform X3 [Panicum hallii]|uniref:uncharacterized protein LOC112890764 isoform X3 n=1 Tax=Panicum hallii TaxID=206008 RepID=UPI000DF4E393|nr:uncharacterized protein LOC112890764 isoform X3 [Panicum hallii]